MRKSKNNTCLAITGGIQMTKRDGIYAELSIGLLSAK